MSALSIQPTFPIFTDTDGSPLENGYIWIGTVNLPAQTSPIAVYWDAALTIPATQPIRTQGGYPSRNGSPARLYVNSDYSILVQNKNGSMVYSAPDGATDRLSAAQITYFPAGTGAVSTTVQAKLRETVSVFDFMTAAQIAAVQAGTSTDDTAAFIAARNYVASVKGRLNIPAGTYILQQATSLVANDTDWYFDAGAVLKLTDTQATTSFITFTAPVNQRIFGMRVNANRPVQNPTIFGQDNSAVLVVDATKCTFDGVEIINSPGKGFVVVSTPAGFTRDVSVLNFTGADCKEQVLLVDGNNRLGFFERIIIDGVKIGATGNFGLCLNDGAGQVTVSNVISEIKNSIGDAVYIRDSFDLQLSNIRASSGRSGLGIERFAGYTGRIELSNICAEFNDQSGILMIGAENITASAIAAINNNGSGITITQTGSSYRSKNINIGNCSAYDSRVTPQQTNGVSVQAVDGCRIGELTAYGNTVRDLSILRATTSDVVAPTRQVVSGPTGLITANSVATVSLSWPVAFQDANINIESVYVSVATVQRSLAVTHVIAITTAGIQVQVSNLNLSLDWTGTLTVIASRQV